MRLFITTTIITFFCIHAGIALPAHAQSDLPADSLAAPTTETETNTAILPEGVKSYDGFLLDMGGLMKSAAPVALPDFRLTIPDASKDYSYLFRLNPEATYTQGLSRMFSRPTFYGLSPYGLYGWGGALDNLQMGSFRLKNNWQLNTYGEYNKDGYKVFNPSALPWERNNFKGAFELKSADGSFGIRVEVQKGRETPF